jgi:GTPase SAR1 family protein
LQLTNPTHGFERSTAVARGFKVQFFGLGGAAKIRGYWDNYYDEAHAILFVVDASDAARLNEAAAVFAEVRAAGRAVGKPILVLANKQDLDNPLSATELAIKLQLDPDNTNSKIVRCTALAEKNNGVPDPAIEQGFDWLLGAVDGDLANLDDRIKVDKAARKVEEAAKLEAQKERVANDPTASGGKGLNPAAQAIV